MTVDPYIITSLLEANTSAPESGELIAGLLLNWPCASCWVDLIFSRRQFNLPTTLAYYALRQMKRPHVSSSWGSNHLWNHPTYSSRNHLLRT